MKNQNGYLWIGAAVIVVSVLLIIFLPKLLMNWDCGYEITKDGGNIGSAIGGMTAPIIGVTTAILLFIALLSTIKINQDQTERFIDAETKNHVNNVIQGLTRDFNAISELFLKYYKEHNNEENVKKIYQLRTQGLAFDRLINAIINLYKESPVQ